MATVIIPVYGQFDSALECILRVILHTHIDHRIIVIDDASPGHPGEFEALLTEASLIQEVQFVRNTANLGFVETINLGFTLAELDDVAIVNSDVLVSDDWLERMIRTSQTSHLTATVTTMTNRGANASVNLSGKPMPDTALEKLDYLNNRLSEFPPLVPATLPSGVGHCMLVTRKAISTVGKFSLAYSPGYGEEVDFSLRALKFGFIHLLAPDVFVWHDEGASFGQSRSEIQRQHEDILKDSYQGYYDYVHTYEKRQDRALTSFARVHVLLHGMNLLLDGRMIHGAKTGAGVVAMSLARELVNRLGFENFTLLLNPAVYDAAPDDFQGIRVVTTAEIYSHVASAGKYDIVFRPGQVDSLPTLQALWEWARRVSILQLDFIAFDNWFYHQNAIAFRRFQDANITSALMADSMMYLSSSVYEESSRTAPRLLGPSDVTDFKCGIEKHSQRFLPNEESDRLIVILGTSFMHKNRIYALHLLSKLKENGDEKVHMHFIGADPTFGGSRKDEINLVKYLGIEDRVQFTEWLPEEAVNSIFSRARVALYPTISEGFGLIPFESAAHGVAPLFAKQTSLNYLFPDVPEELSLIDIDQDALTLKKLLDSEIQRIEQIQYINGIAQQLSWEEVVNTLVRNLELCVTSHPRVNEIFRTEFFTSQKDKIPLSIRLRGNSLFLKVFPVGSKPARLLKNLYLRLHPSLSS